MRFGVWNVPAEMSVGHTAAGKVLLVEVLLSEVVLVELVLDVVRSAARVVVADTVGVKVVIGIADEEEEGGFPIAVQPYPTLIVMLSQPYVEFFASPKIL